MNSLTVTPAFGKDYTSARDALAAWKAGRDFKIEAEADEHGPRFMGVGRYVSANDLISEPTTEVWIRFAKLQRKIQVPMCQFCAHRMDGEESHMHGGAPNPGGQS